MPYNPASVDPMTGRNLTDFNVLYAVFDALIDFNPATLELRPGLAKAWRFADPEDAGARSGRGREIPRRRRFRRLRGEAEHRALQDRSALQREGRSRDGRQRRGQRAEQGHDPPQQTQCRPADDPDQPRRPHGVPEIDQGKGRERRPQAGRHRPVQIRVVAGQFQFHAHCETRTTGRRVCPISTASTCASSASSILRCARL